jgi:predicted secreted protein
MAIAGVGTEFRRWSGSAWEKIAEVNNISGPTMTRETIDTTSLDTTGGYRTFITGFRDGGQITFAMNFTRDEYETLKADFESDDLQDYEIVLPDDDNTSFEFQGLVTEIPLTIPPGDKVTVDVTIKISGEVNINSGSGSGSGHPF